MRLSSGTDLPQSRNVKVQRHDLGSGQFLYKRVAFHMVRMSMTAKDDLDVVKIETQLRYRLANPGQVSFVVAVDEDVSLGRRDQKGCVSALTHEINIPDYLVRRKRHVGGA